MTVTESAAFIERIKLATTKEDAAALYGEIWRDGHKHAWNDCVHEWQKQDKITAAKADRD